MDSNHRCLDVGQESSPLDHGTIAVAEVGIEPTNSHQALDLAAFPIFVLGRLGKKGPGTICAKHPLDGSGKWCLTPFTVIAEAGFEPASNGL